MEAIIDAAPLSDWVRAQATGAVRRLAVVEAGVHACSPDEVCFHEVGAVDTLVDVVGAFVLIEALGIEKVMVGPIPVGGGSVEIAHGRIGVPAPATIELLEGYDIVGGPEMRELTTPTGALLVGQLHAEVGPLPAMRTERLGYGAGCMKLDNGPNVLRVLIGPATEMIAGGAGLDGDQVVELQSNLDDISSEIIGHTCRLLRDAGALDVWTAAAHMKKDRPGVVLHALVAPGDETSAVKTIFEQTGTLGVRRQAVSRHVATRGNVTVKVGDKEVRVKWGRWQGRLVSVAPEYEDAVAAVAEGLSLKDVMHQAAEAARALLGSGHLLP
jgi:pyridinium-3,5-bisthiocarboxylic acid mononucleotide nickel chelatase